MATDPRHREAALRRWGIVAGLAVSLTAAPGLAATTHDEVASARQAVQQQDWPRALSEWQQLYVKGVPEAPAQLCALYFDGRQGGFDVSRVADWCRRAAAREDPWSLYRVGLLYLTGLGVDQNADQAQALCTTAARDPTVPAGFCLAIAAMEKDEAAREQLRPPQPRPPAPAAPAKLDGTPAENCQRAFAASPFDAVAAGDWCGKAAEAGDPEAQYRLGLIKLTGLDGARDLDRAELDCRRAEAGAKPHSTTAFCLAAIAHLRQVAAGVAMSRQTGAIDADPTTGRALPKTDANPFAVDQRLDLPRSTPTGLSFTCRQVIQWTQFEAPGLSILNPGDSLFGRRIIDYQPADFSALDRAAVTCAEATAPLDPDGSLSQIFATFRKSLQALEDRQTELQKVQRANRADAAQIAEVDRTYRTSHVALSSYSSQESACIDRVRRSWQASRQNNGQRDLEISGSNRTSENGRYIAYGTVNVVDTATPQRGVVSVSMYRCTFAGGEIAKFQLSPGFSAE